MAINVNSTTVVAAILKQIYRDANKNTVWYKSRPLFGLMPKFEGFGGVNMPVPIVYTEGGGVSGSFSVAQTLANVGSNVGDQLSKAFLLTRSSIYGDCMIPGETIEATRGDNFAFVQALKSLLDGTMNKLANHVETMLYRDGSGAITTGGTAAFSTGTDGTFTLIKVQDIVNFEVGDVLVYAATQGGALSDSARELTIKTIDRSLGTILYSGTDPSTWTDATVSIYKKGEAYNNAAYAALQGLDAWIPKGAPGSYFPGATLFSIDRTTDSRLCGQYYDAATAGVTREDAMIIAQSVVAREEGTPDVVVMPHAQHRALIQELGAKKVFAKTYAMDKNGIVADVGYQGVVINGDHGDIRTVAAARCPQNTAFMLTTQSWLLATLFAPLRFLDEDGLRFLRISDADGYEARMVCRGNPCCNQPNANCQITLAAP
jgi:hypothetical protein